MSSLKPSSALALYPVGKCIFLKDVMVVGLENT